MRVGVLTCADGYPCGLAIMVEPGRPKRVLGERTAEEPGATKNQQAHHVIVTHGRRSVLVGLDKISRGAFVVRLRDAADGAAAVAHLAARSPNFS